jgi:hypothetical protein
MDDDSYNMWIKAFLVLHTDTFRDFIHYLADEDIRSGLDYMFLEELSCLYKAEEGTILQGAIYLDLLSKISRGGRAEDSSYLNFISIMESGPECVDPFSYDRHFNSKLHALLDSLAQKPPISSSMFPNCIMKKLADSFAHEINSSDCSLYTLLRYYKNEKVHYDSPYKYRPTPRISKFNEEDSHPNKGRQPPSDIIRPFAKKRKSHDFSQDWTTKVAKDELTVMYWLFYMLSLVVDLVMKREVKYRDGQVPVPVTNLRPFAKKNNLVVIVVVLLVAVYLLRY